MTAINRNCYRAVVLNFNRVATGKLGSSSNNRGCKAAVFEGNGVAIGFCSRASRVILIKATACSAYFAVIYDNAVMAGAGASSAGADIPAVNVVSYISVCD